VTKVRELWGRRSKKGGGFKQKSTKQKIDSSAEVRHTGVVNTKLIYTGTKMPGGLKTTEGGTRKGPAYQAKNLEGKFCRSVEIRGGALREDWARGYYEKMTR